MLIFFFLIGIVVNYLLLFKIKVNYKLIYLPIMIIVPLIFIWGIAMNQLSIPWTDELRNLGKSLILTSGVFTSMCFFKAFVPITMDMVLTFHKKHNAKNLDRFPISFFFKFRNQIILGYYVFAFIAGVIMLSGIYFGDGVYA